MGHNVDIAALKQVDVQVLSFNALLASGAKLALDNYQRPYVWTQEKIHQLLDDLNEFHHKSDQSIYYLGSLLLHRTVDGMFVIDGQQRLSSLAVLYYSLKGKLPENLAFHYRSPISVKNLRIAQQIIQQAKPDFNQEIFDKVQFTVIVVDREDLAFTFFDTQNNRGVPLNATDLLKAYHLRAIRNDVPEQSEALQMQCAKRWEDVQLGGGKSEEGVKKDFAPELFHTYLWRARHWIGQNDNQYERHDLILESFQHQSIQPLKIDEVPLYAGRSNTFARTLSLDTNNEYRLTLNPVAISENPILLPFELRQPIHKGVGFFLYAQKYAALLNELFYSDRPSKPLMQFRVFYQQVVQANSYYLRELFKLAALMYYDQFAEFRLLEFSQRLELVLGAIRLDKKYIFQQAQLKYLKESQLNIFNVINSSYRPDEVMQYLKKDRVLLASYHRITVEQQKEDVKIICNKGVQGRYLAALFNYYDLEDLPKSTDYWDQQIKLKNKDLADV